jgi:hypothetical protein
MNLFEISKLPASSFKVIDNDKIQGYPLKWSNIVRIMYNGTHRAVRRSTAYNYGLCVGAHGLPPQPQRSELRQNPGRKNARMNKVTIQVSDEVLNEFGGLRRMQKTLITFVESKI